MFEPLLRDSSAISKAMSITTNSVGNIVQFNWIQLELWITHNRYDNRLMVVGNAPTSFFAVNCIANTIALTTLVKLVSHSRDRILLAICILSVSEKSYSWSVPTNCVIYSVNSTFFKKKCQASLENDAKLQ